MPVYPEQPLPKTVRMQFVGSNYNCGDWSCTMGEVVLVSEEKAHQLLLDFPSQWLRIPADQQPAEIAPPTVPTLPVSSTKMKVKYIGDKPCSVNNQVVSFNQVVEMPTHIAEELLQKEPMKWSKTRSK